MEAFENEELEIERLKKRLGEERSRARELYAFEPDQDAAERQLDEVATRLEELLEAAKSFSGSTKERYQASQQLVPSDLTQRLTSLELLAESCAQDMEEKQREQKRARTVRSDYLSDLDAIQAWIRQAELKVQDQSVVPSILRDSLKQLQEELIAITDNLERLTRNGRIIAENTRDEEEKQRIENTVHGVTDRLSQLKSSLDERRQAVSEAVDAWQRFLDLYELVKAWAQEKRGFLQEPLKLGSLAEARKRLQDYSTAVKSCKQMSKNLSDMSKELESIRQVCVGDLPKKLLEVEEDKVEIESRLSERNALLQETSEEWEQCERKMKDVRTWIERARQSLDSRQNKKKPLRDQHSMRDKMLSDITNQRTKICLSMEKLQVHFNAGIGDDSRIGETVDELVAELDRLHGEVKEQTTSLEGCLSQINRYQQEIQNLRQQVIQAEQQLRTVLSPTYLPSGNENAIQEQQDCQDRIRSLQIKIQARTERCKILAQRGTPDAEPLEP